MNVLEFVRSVAPDVAAKSVGVPLAMISSLERELGIRFPDVYGSFLLGMGYDTGGLALMGPSHTTDLRELLAVLPAPDERANRYWRVSIDRDLTDPNGGDLYLDLATSDGADAQLVKFAVPPDPGEEPDYIEIFTFFERLRNNLFNTYICVDTEVRYTISVGLQAYNINKIDVGEVLRCARMVLDAEGFIEFAPYRHRVSYFQDADRSVTLWSRGIPSVVVEATDATEGALLVEKFRDHIPAPTVVRLYRPPRT